MEWVLATPQEHLLQVYVTTWLPIISVWHIPWAPASISLGHLPADTVPCRLLTTGMYHQVQIKAAFCTQVPTGTG